MINLIKAIKKESPDDNSSNYLYHFTSKEILIEHILSTYKLKLNVLNATNDPREKKFSVYNSIENIDFVGEYLEIKSKIESKLDHDYKICCFSTDYVFNSKKYKGYNLPKMWAMYGDRHKGICLVINKKEFEAENNVDDKNCFLRPVNYSLNPNNKLLRNFNPSGSDYDLEAEKIIKENLNIIFYTKHFDWSSECEVRFVTKNPINYCSIRNSLECVVLGIDFCLSYKPLIDALLAKNKNVIVKRIHFDYISGNLQIKEGGY